jgi:hypothetical protein
VLQPRWQKKASGVANGPCVGRWQPISMVWIPPLSRVIAVNRAPSIVYYGLLETGYMPGITPYHIRPLDTTDPQAVMVTPASPPYLGFMRADALPPSRWERVRVREGRGTQKIPLTPALTRRGLCTISRFWAFLLDLYRYNLINSTLNFELLCKAPGGRGRTWVRLTLGERLTPASPQEGQQAWPFCCPE